MPFNPVKTFFKAFGMAAVCAAIGFFAAEFLSILSLSIYGVIVHHIPDFTITYKFIGAPFGLLTFVAVFAILFIRDVRHSTASM